MCRRGCETEQRVEIPALKPSKCGSVVESSSGLVIGSLTRLQRLGVSPLFVPPPPGFICPGRRRTGVANNMKDDAGVSLRRDSVAVSQRDRTQNAVSQLESSHHSAE